MPGKSKAKTEETVISEEEASSDAVTLSVIRDETPPPEEETAPPEDEQPEEEIETGPGVISLLPETNPDDMVPVKQIPLGKEFEFGGKKYKVTGYHSDKIIAWCGPTYYDDKAFEKNTLVKRI